MAGCLLQNANGSTIVSHPLAPNRSGEFSNFGPSHQQVADDFVVGAENEIRAISWYGGYPSDSAAITDSVAFSIRLFADQSGTPASVPSWIAEVHAKAIDTGKDLGTISWLSYMVEHPVPSLTPGVYWLSIVEIDPRTPTFTVSQWLWADTTTAGHRALRNSDNAVWVADRDTNHAFAIVAVPELGSPRAGLLIAVMCAAVLLVRSREEPFDLGMRQILGATARIAPGMPPKWILLIGSLLVGLVNDRVMAYVAVFGGPEFLSSVGTGYVSHGQYLGRPINDSGQSVVIAAKHVTGTSYGTRAFRVDSVAGAIELGHLGTDNSGDTIVHVNAINAVGTAVGVADRYDAGNSLGPRAVRWDGSGTAATELGNLGTRFDGYTSSWAYGVNDSGTAVGFAERHDLDGNYGRRPVRWDGSGTAAIELGILGTDATGFAFDEALAINNRGTAIGNLFKFVAGESLGQRAVRWESSGTSAIELGNLGTESDGRTVTTAFDINEAGTVVGYAQKNIAGAIAGGRAVRWDGSGTSATELGHLGTDSFGETGCEAIAVNASGTAVGRAYKYVEGRSLGERAVRWDAMGTSATELGHLAADDFGVSYNWANDINDHGIAVGVASIYEFGNLVGEHAVAWGEDAQAIDLNTLIDPASGWRLSQAYGISNTGWISGIGKYDPDGPGIEPAYHRLFLLQIPEPATFSLVVAASFGAFSCRRRWPADPRTGKA